MEIIPSAINNFYMSPLALNITLNAMGDANMLSVSVYANAKVTVYHKGIIDYNPDNNYRQWTLSAYNTFFENNVARYCHLAISKTGDVATVVYPDHRLDLCGRAITDDCTAFIDSNNDESEDYWFVFIGKISSSASGYREWEIGPYSGNLDTDQYRNEENLGDWAKMFSLNTITDMIVQLKPLTKLILGTAKKIASDIWTSEDSGTPSKPDETLLTYGGFENEADSKYLRKDKNDTAKGHITFEEGLTSKGTLYSEKIDNSDKITTKDLEVTGSAHFYEVVIDKARKTGGISFQSCASAKLDIVDTPADNVYRCYFLAKDSDGKQITNDFLKEDQILMMTFNIGSGTSYNVSNRFYWAKCVAISSSPITKDGRDYHWLDIDMKVKADNSNSVPQVDDEIVVLGHRGSDESRKNTIIFASIANSFLNLRRPDPDEHGNLPLLEAPMMVQLHGINSFEISYNNPSNYGNIISNGYNSLRGDLHSSSSFDGKTFTDIFDDYDDKIKDIDSQLDDSFKIWHVDYAAPTSGGAPIAPTLSEYEPSKDWTADEYSEHEGDFIVTTDGVVYEFRNEYSEWGWKIVTDKYLISAITEINTINATLNDMASDSVITREELPNLNKIWEKEVTDYKNITDKAGTYGITSAESDYYSSYSTFVSSYNSIKSLMEKVTNALLSDNSVSIADTKLKSWGFSKADNDTDDTDNDIWDSLWNIYWTNKTLLDTALNESKVGKASFDLKQEIIKGDGEVVKQVNTTLGSYYTKEETNGAITTASSTLEQSIKADYNGKIEKVEQDLSAKWDDETGKKAIAGLKEEIVGENGEISKATSALYSQINDTFAKVETTVQKNTDGTLTSKIKLKSDTLEIDTSEFLLNENGALFSGDVKIGGTKLESGDVENPKILLSHTGAGHIANKNISWNKDGDITFKLAGINFEFDNDTKAASALKWLLQAFEPVIDGSGNLVAINCKYDFWSNGSIAAYGKAQGGSSSSGGGSGGSSSGGDSGSTGTASGSISGNNEITVSGVSGDYTLVYLDASGNELTDYEEITQ